MSAVTSRRLLRRSSCHSHQRGVAAVELALLLTPLLVMLFGTSEIGRAIHTYNMLDKTVRDAARHLSQHGPGDSTVAGEARCLAAYGTPDCAGEAIAPGLSPRMVTICDAALCALTHANQSTGSGSINLVTVGITGYVYTPLVNFVLPTRFTFNTVSITLRGPL